MLTSIVCRRRGSRVLSISHPTRPRKALSQAYATLLAICREIVYPQAPHFSYSGLTWLNPPPLGQSLVILIYWIIISLFLTTGSIVPDAYYYERIGFRAAWVSVTQVPLVYLLAGKTSIVSYFIGSSYIDIIWLHKWVSRTLFVTVTVHGAFFIREWVRADFFQMELAMMPMVKYGLGLWGTLAWINISSLLPLRRLCYEFFLLQHILSAAVFLWLLHTHVPAYASYNVWMAVAFFALGQGIRGCFLVYRNVKSTRDASGILGHTAKLRAMPGDITVLIIPSVGFSWTAGQHVLLWCPGLRPLESHPFTISNVAKGGRERGSRQFELIIRARSGFTQRLHRYAASSSANAPATIKAFVTGPFGTLPAWNTFETLVLISASTGASFTLPILESVLRDPCCVRRIDCLFLVRHQSHITSYIERLEAAAAHSKSSELSLRIEIAITRTPIDRNEAGGILRHPSTLTDTRLSSSKVPSFDITRTTSSASTIEKVDMKNDFSVDDEEKHQTYSIVDEVSQISKAGHSVHYAFGRPVIPNVIRAPVEASAGETSVVVCAGSSLTSTIRNCVASLSDERAVHKGTGAQGIHLHVESFG